VPSIIVDAGPLIALFDRNDRHHRRAVKFIRECRSSLVTNLPVLTEATFLLRFSVEAQRDLLLWVHRAIQVDGNTHGDLPRIADLLGKYRDMPADFADASLVALAERLDILQVASVDKDLTVYRTLGKRPFDNLFWGTA
jgi:predicted nucleic acid-binding protein